MSIGNNRFLTEVDIRLFLRDADPEANLLLDNYEFTSEEIRSAMTFTVDKWNETPPDVALYDIDNFPFRFMLLKGTCANLLYMAAMRYRRNDLQVSMQGGAVNDQAKHAPYDAAADRLWSEYVDWMMRRKVSMNIESGFTVIG
jgi:hypothetical protein